MATQFNLTQAIRDQVPLSEINRELASQKGFDYDAAFADIKEARRGEIVKGGFSPENISDSELDLFANETILTELSDGKYARVDSTTDRGMYEGLLIDLPSSLGLARGVQEGFLRTPGPLPVKLLGGAVGGTVGGIMTYTPGEIIARGDPTGLTGFEGIFPSEPLPSQRAAVEAARTYTGALSGLMLLPGALKQGTVNLAGDKLIRNIENMAPGLKRSLATAGQKIVSGAERVLEGVAKPFGRPTTRTEALLTSGRAMAASVAPATGAFIAETVDPYDPLTRVGAEISASAVPTLRIASFITDKTARPLLQGLKRMFSRTAREESAGRQMVSALETLDKKYADIEFDQETFLADLDAVLENSPLEELVQRVNEGLREGRTELIVPPLTVAQRTAGATKEIPGADGKVKVISPLIALEALDRGLRNMNTKNGGYGEVAQQLYDDFKIFSARLMEELLTQAQGDPRALAEAAEIQEAVYSSMLTQQLESAKEAAVYTAGRVQTPLRKADQSELLVTYVNQALEDADSATNALYTRAKERLAGESIAPTQTLAAIKELQDQGATNLPPLLTELIRVLSPDASGLEANITRLTKLEDEALLEVSRARTQAANYLLTAPPRVERELEPLMARIESVPYEQKVEMLREQLDFLTAPSTFKGGDVRSEAAYIRRFLPVLRAENEAAQISNRIADERLRLGGMEASEVSIGELLDYRSRLNRAARNVIDPNNAQMGFYYSRIEDGMVRDLERMSGGSSLLEGGTEGYQSFESLLDRISEEGRTGVEEGLILLRQANAFNRAKHDVFTRSFAGDLRQKDRKGDLRINPKIAFQKLFTGSADEVAIKLEQVEDAINWINTGGFDAPRRALTQTELDQLSGSAISRIGTYRAGKNDLLKTFFRAAVDTDPESETFNMVSPAKARTFLDRNQEALGPIFPDVFRDINDAVEGRIRFADLQAELKRVEKTLEDETILFQFRGVHDNPSKRMTYILGTPKRRPDNPERNFSQLLDEINRATTGKPEEKMAAKRALVSGVLDSAWIYATPRNPGEDIDFTKFKAFLFDPLDEKQGDSVANILLNKGFILPDAFDDYQTLITQASAIANVMKKSGPQSVETLKDKGAMLSNILVRALGAIGANVTLNRLKGIIGNVPGASMSVAQTTSNATAELGLNMPAMKVQDIFTEAMLYPNVTRTLLAPQPKTESAARRFFGSIPAIFYTSGVRGVTESIKQTETGPIPIDYAEEVYRDVVPQPQPEPTAPEPRATAPEAMPSEAVPSEPTVPEQDALWSRVLQQESGNRQVDDQGRIMTSRVGALGVAQVMPATAAVPGYNAPNIFKVASGLGVPINAKDQKDLDRLLTLAVEQDSEGNKIPLASKDLQEAKRLLAIKEVNEAFGRKYFDGLYSYFGGDPVRTLIAYNAGPDYAKSYKGDPATLPDETQNYLVKILGVAQAPAPAPKETPPVAQAAPMPAAPATPAPAPITPQSLQRTAQVLGPQDEIGMLASELMMRQGPA